MAVDWFCRNAIGPHVWECETMRSVVWVHCANLCRVCVKSIDSLTVDKGPVRSWSHYGSTLIIMMCIITPPVR